MVRLAADVPVFPTRKVSGRPLRIARKGSTVQLLEQAGEWCRIQGGDPQSEPWTGYVRARYRRTYTRAGFDDVIVAATPAQADRAWFAVDAARFWYSNPTYFSSLRPFDGETLRISLNYPEWSGSGAGMAISGGIGLGGGFGLAGRVDALSRDRRSPDYSVSLSVPSPHFPRTYAYDSVPAPALERRDLSFDLSAVYTFPSTDWVRVRVLGGPSYFHVADEMVEQVRYTQTASASAPVNEVVISSLVISEVTASTWGYHAGMDVSGYFQRHLGIGGLLRFSHGTVNVPNPLCTSDVSIFCPPAVEREAGHWTMSGGLRVRF